jgi:hypothetical protein
VSARPAEDGRAKQTIFLRASDGDVVATDFGAFRTRFSTSV